jgi:hypothetical protein
LYGVDGLAGRARPLLKPVNDGLKGKEKCIRPTDNFIASNSFALDPAILFYSAPSSSSSSST